MDLKIASTTLKQEMEKHGLIDLGWKPEFDEAKRRFGVCKPAEKIISISRPLALLNPEVEVLDTILHEIAHALAWEKHGNCGHDDRWKSICVEIGARPDRCYEDDIIEPNAPWLLCHSETGEVFQSYVRKPADDISEWWIPGRKEETCGKLIIRANDSLVPVGKITSFSRESVLAIREEILAVIQSAAEARGITFSANKTAYTNFDFTLNLEFKIKPPEGFDPDKEEFGLFASAFNLQPEDYLRIFRIQGIKYRLTGFKPQNRKYPVLGKDVTGKRFKFSSNVLKHLE